MVRFAKKYGKMFAATALAAALMAGGTGSLEAQAATNGTILQRCGYHRHIRGLVVAMLDMVYMICMIWENLIKREPFAQSTVQRISIWRRLKHYRIMGFRYMQISY